MATPTSKPGAFWQEHRGLVWSNAAAGDATRIRAALLQPRFGLLLDIAHEFGVARLRLEWDVLMTEGTPEAKRAQTSVERILNNIEKGFALASTRD